MFKKIFGKKISNSGGNAENELLKRVHKKEAIEKSMVEIAALFRSPDTLDNAINQALKTIVELSGSERAYVLQLKDSKTQYMSHEYCRWNVLPIKKRLQNVPYRKQPWMIDQYLSNGHVAISNVDKMPKEADDIKAILKNVRVGSMLTSSFASNYTYRGVLCLTNRRPVKCWDSEVVQLIQLVATLIENLIERVDAEEKLTDAKIKAEESDNLKSSFLMNLSHEVRTPLNSIIGFSHLLVNGKLSSERKVHISNMLSQKSLQLLNVIDNLMDIARIESNNLMLEITNFKIKTVIDRVIGKYILEAKEKNISLNTEIENPLLAIDLKSDFHRLAQMTDNLVQNALKFTSKGEIIVSAKIEEDIILIQVSDTGLGIKKDHFENIFKRFWQVDMSSTRKYGGNGLGLSVAKELAQLMGYAISVDSEYGKGSTFTITIPLTEDIGSRKNIVNKNSENRKKILVLDNHDIIHSYLRHILEPAGYLCTFVVDVVHAIQILRDQEFHVIIIDTQFQDYSGMQIYELIMKEKVNTPVIAHSIMYSEKERKEYLQSGFIEYLEKPHHPEKLLDAIAKSLSESK